ncbi:MAG: hypothetical protein ABW170_20170 [Candidatus Thiodiazotropha sp. L084R]
MWRIRWWLILFAGLSAVVAVYMIPVNGQGLDDSVSSDQWIRIKFALLFSFLAVQLTAWFICILKAIVLHQLKWAVGLLFFPPAAFAYLMQHR